MTTVKKASTKKTTSKSSKKKLIPKTLVLMILDESSSMQTGMSVTMSGFNEQVDVIKQGAKDVGNTDVSLVTFASNVKTVFAHCPAESLDKLNSENYRPNGCTALYDAIWHGVQLIRQHPDAEKEDTAVLVNIITDGEENSSRAHNAMDVRELMDSMESTGRWTFTLMGPKQGLHQMSQILNIAKGNVTGFDPNSVADRDYAMKGLVGSTASYMSSRSMGVTACANFYADHNGNNLPEQEIPSPTVHRKMGHPDYSFGNQITSDTSKLAQNLDLGVIKALQSSSDPLGQAFGNFANAVNDVLSKQK